MKLISCFHFSALFLFASTYYYANAMDNAYDGSFGAAFVNSWGPPETIYATAGVLIGSRVIVHVAHSRGNGTCDGTIRNINQNTQETYEQHWTGYFHQHPLYATDTAKYDFAVIVLDQPIANLCAATDAPRVLPLPFDIQTGLVTVAESQLTAGTTKCRHYGYGASDFTKLKLGFSTYAGLSAPYIMTNMDGQQCLANGDSGGPFLCKIGCEWRLLGLDKGIGAYCGTTNQRVYGSNFRSQEFRDFLKAMLQEHSQKFGTQLIDDIVQSQQKCAGVPSAWEMDSSPTCTGNTTNTTTNGAAAPIGKTIALKCNNGLYVSVDPTTAELWCRSATIGDREKFTVVDVASGGMIALKSPSLAKFVISEYGYYPMHANRDVASYWEYFAWEGNADGTFSLKSYQGKYVSSENGERPMWCNKDWKLTWETFSYQVVA